MLISELHAVFTNFRLALLVWLWPRDNLCLFATNSQWAAASTDFSQPAQWESARWWYWSSACLPSVLLLTHSHPHFNTVITEIYYQLFSVRFAVINCFNLSHKIPPKNLLIYCTSQMTITDLNYRLCQQDDRKTILKCLFSEWFRLITAMLCKHCSCSIDTQNNVI